jgi:hypothetical protein
VTTLPRSLCLRDAAGKTNNPHRLIDWDLLVHYGGKERPEVEFSELMGAAGFALARTVPIKNSYLSVLEGINRTVPTLVPL